MPVQKPEAMNEWIGGAWLASTHGLELVMPLKVVSRIGGRRSTTVADDITTETFVAAMRPAPTWRGHLTFHLKHEVPHLELLARLFEQLDDGDVADWITAEPDGRAYSTNFSRDGNWTSGLPSAVPMLTPSTVAKSWPLPRDGKYPTGAGGCETTCRGPVPIAR
jgi:hypothetical protein